MSPLLNRSCCPFWMTFTFESDDDRAPHLLRCLLYLYLYLSTNIYQKYKSVELGDQLAPHLLSWLFLSAGRNRTLVTTNWVNIVYLQVRAHCSTVLSIWKGVQLLLWCIFCIFWCIFLRLKCRLVEQTKGSTSTSQRVWLVVQLLLWCISTDTASFYPLPQLKVLSADNIPPADGIGFPFKVLSMPLFRGSQARVTRHCGILPFVK